MNTQNDPKQTDIVLWDVGDGPVGKNSATQSWGPNFRTLHTHIQAYNTPAVLEVKCVYEKKNPEGLQLSGQPV